MLGRRRGGAGLLGPECRPRALEGAVDGGDRRVEELRDLGRLPLQDLAEDQDGPLARGEVLERRDEREADRLPQFRHGGRIAGHGQDAAVRDRLDPGDLRERRTERGIGGQGRSQVHRPGPSFPSSEHVEADVRGDAIQPRSQGCAALESIEPSPCPHERVLDGVLRLECRSEHPVAVGGQLDPMQFQLGSQRLGTVRCSALGRVRCGGDVCHPRSLLSTAGSGAPILARGSILR